MIKELLNHPPFCDKGRFLWQVGVFVQFWVEVSREGSFDVWSPLGSMLPTNYFCDYILGIFVLDWSLFL